jgi:hypothetical protein
LKNYFNSFKQIKFIIKIIFYKYNLINKMI